MRLAMLPTPLHEAARLRFALGGPGRCPRILFKRDDCTGLAFGGNKARKLEFLVADAARQGATYLVTSGPAQSNHARMTAAAARMAGMGVALVLSTKDESAQAQGNLLLDRLLDAEIHFFPAGDDPTLATAFESATVERVVGDLRARGERPYLIPTGGSNAVGACGYVSGTLELVEQLWKAGEAPGWLYYASGSRGTQAGLMLGAKMYSASYQVMGVAVSDDTPEKTERAVRLAREAAALLRVDTRITAGDAVTDPRHMGPAYGVATPECLEAIAIVARCEGILLDPVYTGKAMAALIHDVRHGKLGNADDDASVVFLHTGGTPAIFAYADRLAAAFEREHTAA